MKAAEVAKKTMDTLAKAISPDPINRLVKEVQSALQALKDLDGSAEGAPNEIQAGKDGLKDAESARKAWVEVVACLTIQVQESAKIGKVTTAIANGETWNVSSGEPRVRQAQVEENGPSKSGEDDMRDLKKLLKKMEACKKARDALTAHTARIPTYQSGANASASQQAKRWYDQVDGLIQTANNCEVEQEHIDAAATAKSTTFNAWRSGTQQAANNAVSRLRTAHQSDLRNDSIENLSDSQFNDAVSAADNAVRAARHWDDLFAQGKEEEIDAMRTAVQTKCTSNQQAHIARDEAARNQPQGGQSGA